jgi:membrane-associated phospholipid phosphatase
MRILIVRGVSLFICVMLFPRIVFAQDRPTPRPVLETIKQDLKSVWSSDTASVLSIATAFALAVSPFDETLTRSSAYSTFQKTTFEPWARVAGQEWLLGGSALATFAIGRFTNEPKLAALGGDLMEAQALAGASTLALKLAVRRTRPDGEPRSFPSGHASGTFAAATVVQRHFGWKGAVPAYTAAGLITVARLQANSHYPTDLVVGAALGILSGRAATFDLGPRRVRLAPAATPGGVAVSGSIH